MAKHVILKHEERWPRGGAEILTLPDDGEIVASTYSQRGKLLMVVAYPVCGEETASGSPCRRTVDSHDEKCHDHS